MRFSRLLLPALVASLLVAEPAAAQSIVSGTVSGTVEDASGLPVTGAVVLLRAPDLGLAREATVDRTGHFAFRFVLPGVYEARVEALGYQPVLLRPVVVSTGDVSSFRTLLEEATPPVMTMDTVDLSGTVPSRWRAGGSRLEARDVDELPDRTQRLTSVALLSSLVDESLGADGLPGNLSLLFLDGVPFRPAAHPAVRGERLGASVLPRAALADMTVLADGPDVEYTGAAGSYLAASTRKGTSGGGPVEVGGGWSSDALWSSQRIEGDPPALSSIWGDARISVDLVPDTSGVFLAAQGQRRQEPVAARVADSDLLSGLDPTLVSELTTPSVQEVTQVGGVGRLDWWISPTRRFLLRAVVGREERTFVGPSTPGLAYGASPAAEATDFSLGAGIVSELRPRLTLEFRGGLSASSRTYGTTGLDVPPTLLAGDGILLGQAAAAPAEASRLDVFVSPIVYYQIGSGTLKVGAQFDLGRNAMTQSRAPGGLFVADDPAALLGGTGSYLATSGPETTFTTTQLGAFLQYGWEPAPGLRLDLGGRVDWEVTPSLVDANGSWFSASGLRIEEYPSRYVQVSGRTGLVWDVTGDGATVMDASVSLQSGDLEPALLHEAFAGDGATTLQRHVGDGISWPGGSILGGAASSPTLTLMGPDMRPPRSSRIGAGLVQRLGGGLSLHVRGSFRRTDFLPRRRNLNLAVLPATDDADGRPIFGELVKQGAFVTVDPGSNRRFPGFDDVWAVDPDGWSESTSFTVGLEHRGDPLELFASYTRSTTTDNWFGAASGTPEGMLPPSLGEDREGWVEGTSDFDVPDRFVAGATLDLGVPTGASVSAFYRYSSGFPFTPGYRRGLDVNGDGSGWNDPAFVPDAGTLGGLVAESCLADAAGGFAERNSCRGPARQSFDARIRIGLGDLGGRRIELRLDGFNLLESEAGIVDDALLLVSPDAPLSSSDDGTVTLPTTVNPSFGEVVFPESPGRILRIGLRIGA